MAKEVIKLIFKTLHMIVENKSITRDDISKLVFGAKISMSIEMKFT